jgi:glycosyltransferase involved in cell wall biosynthesis
MNKKVNPGTTDILGIVVIGRNEGDRLPKCLQSASRATANIVYVDSGSKDGSARTARRLGVDVIELDASTPFSAGRARNAGFYHLAQINPRLEYVQFIDADCLIREDWLPFAAASLTRQPKLAAVAGWLHEERPDHSIYHRFGELEWNSSGVGQVDSVGGIFMIRREAFDSVSGFDPTVAAGEEPELCQRLIRKGWQIARLDHDMALHDLAMTRFGQWWRRMVRGGYGSMDVGCRFGVTSFSRNNRRVLAWACWLAAITISGTLAATTGSSQLKTVTALLLCVWLAKLVRIALRMLKKRNAWNISVAYAFFMGIAFLPQAVGQARYLGDRLLKRSARLIEYKDHKPPSNR